ncbi:MAG: hypothetical protein A2268_14965 [Candidatus Raymondbacteria bacterium RifOxyA12_full_50_37]|nr:MAG: hypothetical protein A2268_14965 [Candidatus Raymondbacteria bacterium RifOxyA12_full_50_37]OGJ88539.1 MAG: hypothetical protein A2248_20295 [Candidatus Raymondbacteria bacterium RIFOXYA2_FULL_49_16]OGJ99000.1 MAG: hypothetical protein A2453_11015 [Candidatus Raymondbacteria bacterium RIFOXYC2_FULL_50_21]OGK00636.1 MAG: hypothetical protein A2487_13860 [Candidatus Raymondbacteria bacterium RifOxyC12_full_50_8]OGP41510.1 MAG: hypothetical protein A2324_05825 [Candidatus Raymondbacteria b
MLPRIKAVTPGKNYNLILIFNNGEKRRFNVKPYLSTGVFVDLKKQSIFNAVRPFHGSIQWPDGQDFCPDMLYEESVPI